MIKAKQAFFSSSELEGYAFHGNKTTTLHLTRKYDSLSVVSENLFSWNQFSKSKVMVI